MTWGRAKAWRAAALAAVVTAYAVGWSAVAAPYRPYPSDDIRFLAAARDPFDPAAGRPQYVVTNLTLAAVRTCCWAVGLDDPTVLPVTAAGAAALTLGVVAAAAYRATGSARAATVAAVLFGTATWPAVYTLFWFYAPVTGLFGAASLYGVLAARTSTTAPAGWMLAAGVAAALCLLSAVSAAVFVALSTAAALAAFRRVREAADRRSVLAYAAGFSPAVAAFAAPGFADRYLFHLRENLTTYHYTDALAKFGTVPRPPAAAGLWVMWTYGTGLTTAALAATAVVVVAAVRRHRTGVRADRATRTGAALALLVWAHVAAVDLLPTTKLGRTHYLAFPPLCVLVGVAAHRASGGVPTAVAWAGIAVLGVGWAAEGWGAVRAHAAARSALPEALAAGPRVPVYVLDGDPHGPALAAWLGEFGPRSVGVAELVDVVRGGPGVLVVGPVGPGSGNSTLRHGCLPDYPPPDLGSVGAAEVRAFPYYAYHPLFCLEEEICQGLLAAGRMPGADAPGAGVTVARWPGPAVDNPRPAN